MDHSTLLIGDIGGTNARFALASPNGPGFTSLQVLACTDYPTAQAAIRHYLEKVGVPLPGAICIAAAGPVINRQVKLTNNSWAVSVSELKKAFTVDDVFLLNDFAAVAHGLPFLAADQLMPLGRSQPVDLDRKKEFTVGVVGPGTGLGAAGLRKSGAAYTAIPSEFGHTAFAPQSQTQSELVAWLHPPSGHVPVEHLVSGPGLENIYRALTGMRGGQATDLSARELFTASASAAEETAVEAVELFYEMLGQVAGDLALSLGAMDGVYVCGGVAQRYPDRLANSRFRSGFEAKGSYKQMMGKIPTYLITHEQPGLFGAACFLQHSLP